MTAIGSDGSSAGPASSTTEVRSVSSARTRGYARVQGIVEPTAVVIAALAGWELFSRSGIVHVQDFPPMSVVVQEMVRDLQEPFIWESIRVTMGAWAYGLALVCLVGVPAGVLLGSSPWAYRASNLTIEFIRTIPSTAAIPLLILIHGTGFNLTVTMVFLGALWALLIQVMYGVQDVDPITRDAGRAYGLGRIGLFRRVSIPSALPYIATGLRLSAVMGLLLAVAASLIAGGEGLGAAIARASTSGAVELMYARIVTAGLLGLAVTLALTTLERRFLFWHPSHRTSGT